MTETFCDKYVKQRYHNDEHFREAIKERTRKWQEAKKDDCDYKERRRAAARLYYQNNPAYREAQKQRATLRQRQCALES